MMESEARRPSRMGAWRLLDLAQASMSLRASLFGSASLPEYGPPDASAAPQEPDEELPGSNISEYEQQRAIERERARRWMTARAQS